MGGLITVPYLASIIFTDMCFRDMSSSKTEREALQSEGQDVAHWSPWRPLLEAKAKDLMEALEQSSSAPRFERARRSSCSSSCSDTSSSSSSSYDRPPAPLKSDAYDRFLHALYQTRPPATAKHMVAQPSFNL